MKVLHVIPSIHPRYGGPSKAVLEMCKYQNKFGIKSEIATTHFKNEKLSQPKNVKVYSFQSKLGEYKYSPKLKEWLKKNIQKYDIIHIHSVFCYPTHLASRLAKKYKIPYIIRTIGQLYPWCLKNESKLKKLFYFKIMEKNNLEKADALHFTTEDEKKNLGLWVNYKSSFILPLGIEKSKKLNKREFKKSFPEISNKKIILFLSRVDPKKGLEKLIPSISNLLKKQKDLVLVIAGNGRKDYINKLKDLIRRYDLQKKIIFVGSVKGKNKNLLLQNSNLFILPSKSENFGISVIEAMQAGLPVAISDKVGIKEEIKKSDAGLIFPLKKARISDSIRKLINNEELRKRLSKNAKKLIKEKYDWNKITKEQIEIYKKIKNE